MNSKKIIALAAGGTGGHFFPAIALAEELAKTEYDIHLLTDYRCKKYITNDMPIIPHIANLHINMSGLVHKIKSAWQLFITCIKAIILFLKLKPSVVIGFGGYPSFPAMFAARILKIPIIIQEQNCFFGKSNKIFAKHAKYIALSYKETNNISPKYKDKIIYTGDIIRKSIRNLPPKKSFNSKIFSLLVIGGSQGALVFSQIIPKAIELLKNIHPDIQIKIIQQVSDAQKAKLAETYNKLSIDYKLESFFHNISDIYNEADLVIARSGASTIAELTTIGLPAIFIPLPHAMEDHQTFNAMALVRDNASWCFNQRDASPEILADKLLELIQNRNLLKGASENLLKRKTNGTKYLADTVLKIIA